MKVEPHNQPITTFSLASLTDIVLLLLIFFLLSSAYIIQPGIKVQLPRSETAQVIEEKNVIVTLTSEGTIYVGSERTSLGALAANIRRHIVHGSAQTIVIKADRRVSLENAVSVIDRIKAAGGEKFLIATLQEEE
ncbi:MAG: biopolymer transporter ExbD [Candidatus Hatepunaea meridiana]|nr:biopolymer transporter ExbD [Candidatus Hatepunaea meridiana]